MTTICLKNMAGTFNIFLFHYNIVKKLYRPDNNIIYLIEGVNYPVSRLPYKQKNEE